MTNVTNVTDIEAAYTAAVQAAQDQYQIELRRIGEQFWASRELEAQRHLDACAKAQAEYDAEAAAAEEAMCAAADAAASDEAMCALEGAWQRYLGACAKAQAEYDVETAAADAAMCAAWDAAAEALERALAAARSARLAALRAVGIEG